MMARGMRCCSLALLGLLGLSACPSPRELPEAPVAPEVVAVIESHDEPIQPLPLSLPLDPRKVALGEKLFASPLLSADGKSTCLTCHPFERGGADGEVLSRGMGGKLAALNTPTVFNVAFSFRLNWNGAFTELEDHLGKPLAGLMGSSVPEVVKRLSQDLVWQKSFSAIYPDGVSDANFRDAVATYERSLITPNSRFDRYLRGEKGILTDEERAGYIHFKEYGCTSCHQGINVGGTMFQKFGVMRDYFVDRGRPPTPGELGRFNVTANEADRFVFRVPSLRNVALTAPYFHDGSAPTLEVAIAVMARYQLGRSLPGPHITRIAAFLRTLTGEYRGKALQ
jgi:cytochrome c peroxidase